MQVDGISFVIISNGKKKQKTLNLINSINLSCKKTSINYEIILSGNTEVFSDVDNLILVDSSKFANTGYVSTMRNMGADHAKYDIIVWCDDDIVLTEDWATKFLNYCEDNSFDVLGNQIRLPDGGRCWDRATVNPHQMIDYDCKVYRGILYQTSGFMMIRREVFDQQRWDDTIPIHADQKSGKMPEDVEYSIRLQQNGFKLSFDKNNIVIHDDDSYIQVDNLCLKKDLVRGK